jgi:hypothetical protein
MKKILKYYILVTVFVFSVYAEESNGVNIFIKRENILKLEQYTEYIKIVEQFGEPDENIGSGFVIVQYTLQNGRKARLNFGYGDKLYALAEITSDGETIEIYNSFRTERQKREGSDN